MSADRFEFLSPAELVGKLFVVGDEFQSDRIDAITLMRGRRAIRKDVSLMAPAAGATNLGASHAKAVVADRHQMFFRKWRGKARPTGAAFEFLVCREQRQPAELAAIDPGLLVVQQDTAKRLLGTVV